MIDGSIATLDALPFDERIKYTYELIGSNRRVLYIHGTAAFAWYISATGEVFIWDNDSSGGMEKETESGAIEAIENGARNFGGRYRILEEMITDDSSDS